MFRDLIAAKMMAAKMICFFLLDLFFVYEFIQIFDEEKTVNDF